MLGPNMRDLNHYDMSHYNGSGLHQYVMGRRVNYNLLLMRDYNLWKGVKVNNDFISELGDLWLLLIVSLLILRIGSWLQI
jgi:hypothetical protein